MKNKYLNINPNKIKTVEDFCSKNIDEIVEFLESLGFVKLKWIHGYREELFNVINSEQNLKDKRYVIAANFKEWIRFCNEGEINDNNVCFSISFSGMKHHDLKYYIEGNNLEYKSVSYDDFKEKLCKTFNWIIK